MITANSMKELFEIIDEDKQLSKASQVRFPIRIIFLSSYNDYKDLVKHLHIKIIDFSKLQPSDNYWFKPFEILEIIKSQNKSCVIFPLSEIIRFLPPDDLKSILGSIMGIENTRNITQRIYIPLIGMYGKFSSSFWKDYYRDQEGAKVWYYDSSPEKKIDIYRLDTHIDTKIPLVKTNRQWLSYWSSNRQTPVISIAKSLNDRWHNFLPDNCFNVNELKNEKQVIEDIHKIKISISFHQYERDHWKLLLDTVEKYIDDQEVNLSFIISQLLNIRNIRSYNDTELLNLFLNQKKEYHRWLLKGYILSNVTSSRYLYLIFDSIQSLESYEVIKELYEYAISNDVNDHEILKQRKSLIINLDNENSVYIKSFISDYLKKLNEREEPIRLSYITNRTIDECVYFIKLIRDYDDQHRLKLLIDFSESIYNYLNYQPNSLYIKHEWILEYFHEYNKSKLYHEKNDKVNNLIDTYNADSKSFYEWYSQFEHLPEIESKIFYQIDGLGVEWLSYIIYLINNLSDHNFEIESVSICKSYLPTITSRNKIPDSNFISKSSLDNYIHSLSAYKPFFSLLDELHIVKSLISDLLKSPHDSIYITGDHGVTVQCLKHFGRIKKYDFNNAEHEGRCLFQKKDFSENEDYIYMEGYYVALKHTSLSSLPKREVHGGATPEEVLVPLIILKKKDKQIDYVISLISKELKYSDKKIKFNVTPKPTKMPLVYVFGNLLECKFLENHFEVNFDSQKESITKIKIVIGNSIKETEVIRLGGMKEEDPFE